MVIPEIKSVISLDIERPNLPADPGDCAVRIDVRIGAKGNEAADIFSFTAMTPSQLKEEPLPCWGRGILVLREFSWPAIDIALERLLAHGARATWAECATVLSKELNWEFDNYQPHPSNLQFDTDEKRAGQRRS